MSNTLTIRLPEEVLEKLKETSRRTGIPMGRLVRHSLETTLSQKKNNPLMKFAGVIKGGPKNLSSRKGFSRS
jgi:predicted DNA-binding protein